MNLVGRKLTALAGVAVIALGGAGMAQAKNGADDPPGHVSGGHGADDGAGHVRHGSHSRADRKRLARCLKRARRSDDRSERKRKVKRCKRIARRHSDDRGGDDRGGDRPAGSSDDAPGDDHGGRGRGSDDGPNHT